MTVSYEVDTLYDLYNLEWTLADYRIPIDEDYECRFCGQTDKIRFKGKAHIIPEFTGNKDLVYKSECDDCNNLFSKYERDLMLFGGVKNIIAGIKGKKYPRHIEKNKFELNYTGENELTIKEYNKNDQLKIQDGKFSVSSSSQKICLRFVQKALVKIALSMIEKEELRKFSKTLDWLQKPEDNLTERNHPIFLLIEREKRPPLKKPGAMLLKKKKEYSNYNSPEYTFLFYYSFFAYQLFLPFNKSDSDLDFEKIKLPLCPSVITDLKNMKTIGFNHYDTSRFKKILVKDKFECNLK